MIEITWETELGTLVARQPTRDELLAHAPALAEAYNEPHNADLMGHTQLLTVEDVVEHYTSSIAGGMRAFLLFCDGAFAGDADLRNIDAGAAEFAFMIGARAAQGRGLGTRFAIMVHAFGFAQLALARIYASVVPRNTASRRVFEKLGYTVDDSEAGRAYAEEPDDIVLVITREAFLHQHVNAVDQLRIAMR